MEMSVSSEMTFFTTKQQSEICPHLRTGSSAEDRGRIDTRVSIADKYELLVVDTCLHEHFTSLSHPPDQHGIDCCSNDGFL